MTFLEAAACLKRGEHVYRPGWAAGTYLEVQNIKGGDVVCKCVDNKPVGFWVSEPGDLSANDWECEVYVLPVDADVMQPGA